MTLTWRVNKYVSHQRKGKNKRNEITTIKILCTDDSSQSPFCFPTTFISNSFQVAAQEQTGTVTIVSRTQEDFITLISEENEGRVTKKLSQELNTTESCILGALAQLEVFLLDPLIQGHFGSVTETSRNTHGENH